MATQLRLQRLQDEATLLCIIAIAFKMIHDEQNDDVETHIIDGNCNLK